MKEQKEDGKELTGQESVETMEPGEDPAVIDPALQNPGQAEMGTMSIREINEITRKIIAPEFSDIPGDPLRGLSREEWNKLSPLERYSPRPSPLDRLPVWPKIDIKVQLLDKKAKLPTREHEDDAGLDLYALEHTILPRPGDVVAVRTGIAIELPSGYHAEIRSRSGMALKHSVVVANSPGTIDNGYRGEIKVLLTCLRKPYKVEAGDKIAQMVLSRDEIFPVVVVDSLSVTERGEAGFGSSGSK